METSQPTYPLIPAGAAQIEDLVVNSRFIAWAGPAHSVEEARAAISRIRATYPDASHHVPAFLIGWGSGVIEHCSDAGEPAGTAGRPILTVLKGSGLGDVVLVVTRYFGGTKLGTGGLVRAYTEAAQHVLAQLPRGRKVPTYTIMTAFPYTYYERVRLLAGAHGGQIVDEDFAADVTLSIRFKVHDLPAFQAGLTELSHGTVGLEIIESQTDTIFPEEAQP